MRKNKMRMCAILLAGMLATGTITACSTTRVSASETTTNTTTTEVADSSTTYEYSSEDIDASFDEESSTGISFSGTSISVDGTGASVSGSTVTISEAGTYILSGELSDGQVIVSADKEDTVRLVLNGVELNCSTSSAIYCEQSEKVIIILADGTQNSVSDATTYVYENSDDTEPDAAIFSKDDLIITGTGALTVAANYNNGIKSKDNLLIASGTFTITAVNNAIHGKDSVTLLDGTYTIDAEHNAIHSKGDLVVEGGTYSLKAVKKGLHAENEVIVNGGTIDVLECYEGIEALKITINNGDISIVASDDGLNAASQEDTDTTTTENGTDATTGASVNGPGQEPGGGMDEVVEGCVITIAGGTLNVDASGDGIDSNGYVYMTGGEVYVNGPTNDGNGPLDYNGDFTISDGTLVAIGSSGMAQTIGDSSTQLGLEIVYTTSQKAGSVVTLLDSSGNEVLNYTSIKDYSSIVISTPELKDGETYTLQSDGTTLGQITLSGTSTVVDETGAETTIGGPGGGGDQPGGPGGGGDQPGGPGGPGGGSGTAGDDPSTPSTPSTPVSEGSLEVQMYNRGTDDSIVSIAPQYKIINTGSEAINLSDVTIRYYYTNENDTSQSFWCDWSNVNSSNVTGEFVTMENPTDTAGCYLEISFSSDAGSLASGECVYVQTRINNSDWSSYTQSNDYSFNSSATDYADWTNVTAYISDSLQWGIEP